MSDNRSYPSTDGHMPVNISEDAGTLIDLDAWPGQQLDTCNGGQALLDPTKAEVQEDYVSSLDDHRLGGPVSTSKTPSKPQTPGLTGPLSNFREGDEVLWFEFGPDFKGDTDLENHYPDRDERMIATLGRDLNVVTTCNVQNMVASSQAFNCLRDCLTFPTTQNPELVTQSLLDVISSLNKIVIALESAGFGKAGRHKQSSSIQTGGETCPASQQTREQPLSNDILFYKFPSNYSNIFLSKLIARYTGMTQVLPRPVVEIADYCVSRDPSFNEWEQLYSDCGGVVLFRKDFYTLDIDVVIAPVIISAWSRVLADLWAGDGIVDRICLDVVDKDILLSEERMVDHWVQWIGGTINKPSELKPDLIFIPMFVWNHHKLLVVNFAQRKVICIDSVYRDDTSVLEKLTAYIVKCLRSYLTRVGDSRGPMLGQFEFHVDNPAWSFHNNDPDSGLTVMHMMETYAGHPSNENASLREAHIRARMRISYISQIVMSNVNLRKLMVYEAASDCVEKKCCNIIAPSEEVTQYRGQFRWVRNI